MYLTGKLWTGLFVFMRYMFAKILSALWFCLLVTRYLGLSGSQKRTTATTKAGMVQRKAKIRQELNENECVSSAVHPRSLGMMIQARTKD
jgi:hypothetical protein